MTSIADDQELKHARVELSPVQQRHLGGLLVEKPLALCNDERIRHALKVAMDPDSSDEGAKRHSIAPRPMRSAATRNAGAMPTGPGRPHTSSQPLSPVCSRMKRQLDRGTVPGRPPCTYATPGTVR